jgi:GNAT superfamily N-acetyltransferase
MARSAAMRSRLRRRTARSSANACSPSRASAKDRLSIPVPRRRASAADADRVAVLVGELAQSFTFSREKFDQSYPALATAEDACPLPAADGDECLGYLLGFRHLTFYANGPVAWVEEILVCSGHRGRGIGRALMSAFERWAAWQNCVLVALATRRAAPFYQALGYEDSATYLRKVLKEEAAG